MLNVATHLPTYGEYMVSVKKDKIEKAGFYTCKRNWTRCKQIMKRKEAIAYYGQKLQKYWDTKDK